MMRNMAIVRRTSWILTSAFALVLLLSVMLCAGDHQTQETAIGNLVADAIRKAANADIALVPSAAFNRLDAQPDDITVSVAISALADSSEPISVMNLTGSQICAALERAVNLYPKPHSGFLQVSGITFRVDAAQPSGQRALNIKADGKEMHLDKKYKTAMPKSLAAGSLGYFRVWQNSKPEELNITLEYAVKSYLESKPDLSAIAPGNRIRPL